ncbi:MAG TPA: hypothetical protein VGL34_14780 [Steroidobacteraceae bacterium]|jgi:hypothetical protein
MTKVFVGGSRRISRLNAEIRNRLDRVVDAGFKIIVGDANGADKAVQIYLQSKCYDAVEVFCAGHACRNNVGNWPTRKVAADKLRGFDFYAEKDRVMADEASYGLMIWDGESIGTLMNVVRLLGKKKPAAVFVSKAKEFVDLHNPDEFRHFLNDHAPEIQPELESRATSELSLLKRRSQMSLL